MNKIVILGVFAALVASSSAQAADMPAKAPSSAFDMPFFFVNDNRFTYAFEPNATEVGATNNVAKQVFAFTHFDAWAYGTNFANLQIDKYGKSAPTAPCGGLGQSSGCAGQAVFYGTIRSTFGFNQIFDTKAFSYGPLQNVSLQVGGDWKTSNGSASAETRLLFAGLQFAFSLPYNGYLNISPGVNWQWNHLAYLSPMFGGGVGVVDGMQNFDPSWALEMNYYMDLGFLPESLPLSISGRAGFYGPNGTGVSFPLYIASVPNKTQIESEPIRLTLDASRMMWGKKYSHFLDVWVAYKYWQNKYGFDHNAAPFCIAGSGVGVAGSCTEQSVYTGVTVKF